MYLNIILRTIFCFLIINQISFKKQLKEFNTSDLVLLILLVGFSLMGIKNYNESIFISLIPIITIILIQVLIKSISFENTILKKIKKRKQSVVIKDGKINFNEMIKINYNFENLITELKKQNTKSIEKVKYAVVEKNGNLSVFKEIDDYPLPIILNGEIDYIVLKDIKKNINWLKTILKNQNLNLEDIYYAFYTKQRTFIIKKSDLI